jgi:hypothetical protein
MNIVQYKEDFASTTKYTKYNTVKYLHNSALEIFMCIRSDTPIGTLPTNATYWIPLTMRGERGVAGVGLSPFGTWNNLVTYPINAMVSHNNALWGSLVENTGIEPSTTSTATWFKLISYDLNSLTFYETTDNSPYQLTIENGNVSFTSLTGQSPIELAKIQDIPSTLPASGGTADTIRNTLPITKGGTGAITVSGILANLGITATIDELNFINGVTGNIQTQLNQKASKSTVTANRPLYASYWSGTYKPYSYSLTVIGATTSSIVEVLPYDKLTNEQCKQLGEAQIACGTNSNGGITLWAYGNKPTIDIPITIILRGDV